MQDFTVLQKKLIYKSRLKDWASGGIGIRASLRTSAARLKSSSLFLPTMKL